MKRESSSRSSWNLLSPRQRKWVLWILALLAFYTVAGFLILPPIIRAVAVKVISRELDRETSIQKIKLNPYDFSVTVDGLLIKDQDGQPFVSWDEVYVNFQISSIFRKAWQFRQISVVRPFARAQMNPDGTFNFSDLIAKFSGTNSAVPAGSSAKPLLLHVAELRIFRATASVADLTVRKPFKRIVGPLDVTLDDFDTHPDSKNPYSFAGTTDAGERIAWSGFFYLDPLRSHGELTLGNLTLNKYAVLYEDLVRFEIRGGTVGVHAQYQFEYSLTNHSASVSDAAMTLEDFKLGAPGDSNNVLELPFFSATGASVDLQSRQARVEAVTVQGATVFASRARDDSINLVQLAEPAETNEVLPGGILFVLRSVTNAVSLLLNSTNQWAGVVNSVNVTNCALHLQDLANARPATLDLTDIAVAAKNISNLPNTNLTAEVSLRWNTNGTIKVATTATLLPTTADIDLDINRLDLGTLDPYLEPKLDLFILGSQVSLHGRVHLRTEPGGLPAVTFHGDASLDNFRTADGFTGEDLLKWDSVRINGMSANLNPPAVDIQEIAVDNASARIIIETNRTINLLNVLRLTDTNGVVSATSTTARPRPLIAVALATTNSSVISASLPHVAIGRLVITNTSFRFTDRSIRPGVNLTIEQINGYIADISSDRLQHAQLKVTALVDGVGPAAISGVINPFDPRMTNSVKILVSNVDLTPTSPYSGKFAGYRIAEGKLGLDLTYNLVGRKLTSENIVTLDQFTFGNRVDSPDATHLPVRLAVAILKDRNGKIRMDVPIQGSLDDPKFRLSRVVIYAIVNVLEKAATSPFSLLGAILGGGGPELAYQDFAPGSADLTPAARQKVDAMAKVLYARPALKLEITGSIDPEGDREGLQRAALDREIRQRAWQTLRQAAQMTNSVEQMELTPSDRATWIKTIYDEAMASGRITPALIAANTNLAQYAALAVASTVPANREVAKGATILMKLNSTPASPAPAAAATYHTKLVPPPSPEEAVLLTLYSVESDDLEALAARRARAVQAYFLQSGKVEAARLFLTQKNGPVRSDGSRVYLQFR